MREVSGVCRVAEGAARGSPQCVLLVFLAFQETETLLKVYERYFWRYTVTIDLPDTMIDLKLQLFKRSRADMRAVLVSPRGA